MTNSLQYDMMRAISNNKKNDMELSILVAKLSALFFIAVGIRAVSGNLNIKKMLASFDDSQGLTIMSGFAMIAIGGLLVENHNIWVKDWPVLVTIIGWASLIKGVIFVGFPDVISFSGGMFKKAPVDKLGYVIIALGLLFGYYGFGL